jgi:hypothetical protein
VYLHAFEAVQTFWRLRKLHNLALEVLNGGVDLYKVLTKGVIETTSRDSTTGHVFDIEEILMESSVAGIHECCVTGYDGLSRSLNMPCI